MRETPSALLEKRPAKQTGLLGSLWNERTFDHVLGQPGNEKGGQKKKKDQRRYVRSIPSVAAF